MMEGCPKFRAHGVGEAIREQSADFLACVGRCLDPEGDEPPFDLAAQFLIYFRAIYEAAPHKPQSRGECIVRPVQHGSDHRRGIWVKLQSELDNLSPRPLNGIVDTTRESIRPFPDHMARSEIFLDDGIGE